MCQNLRVFFSVFTHFNQTVKVKVLRTPQAAFRSRVFKWASLLWMFSTGLFRLWFNCRLCCHRLNSFNKHLNLFFCQTVAVRKLRNETWQQHNTVWTCCSLTYSEAVELSPRKRLWLILCEQMLFTNTHAHTGKETMSSIQRRRRKFNLWLPPGAKTGSVWNCSLIN